MSKQLGIYLMGGAQPEGQRNAPVFADESGATGQLCRAGGA